MLPKAPMHFQEPFKVCATGVGFLRAGEILHISQPQAGKYRIRRLTSAAAIWISAALGLAAGCGLWYLSLIAALLSLIILRILKIFERFHRRE